MGRGQVELVERLKREMAEQRRLLDGEGEGEREGEAGGQVGDKKKKKKRRGKKKKKNKGTGKVEAERGLGWGAREGKRELLMLHAMATALTNKELLLREVLKEGLPLSLSRPSTCTPSCSLEGPTLGRSGR